MNMSDQLRVDMKIVSGRQLIPMDVLSGKSDPYVVVTQEERILHTSKIKKKSLDPEWNDQFMATIKDSSLPLTIKVFDYDSTSDDEFMGEASLDLTQFQYQGSHEVVLQLGPGEDPTLLRKMRKDQMEGLGWITLRVGVSTVESDEGSPFNRMPFFESNKEKKVSYKSSKLSFGGSKEYVLTGMVHLVVVEAMGLLPHKGKDSVNSCCKITLGKKKAKTKQICSFNPIWREGFTIPWFEGHDDFVELKVLDPTIEEGGSPTKLGRTSIDLKHLEREKTHDLWLPMKERLSSHQKLTELEKSEHRLNVPCEGEIHVLITISGTPMGPDTSKKLSMSSVGELTVEVIKAVGLSTKKSWRNQKDLCTVLQVGNSRLQTQTVVNSVNPFFGRTLIFDIEDISEVLEVTVLDDNGDMEDDFMGKVKIPLQSIEDGVERWYRLKCHKSRKGAPGDQPRILLRIELKYQRMQACKSLLSPLSIKYEENQKKEFEFAVLRRNFKRLNNIKAKLNTLSLDIRPLLQWEDPFRSSYALIAYILVVWYLELWMLPFIPLILMAVYTLKPGFILIEIIVEDQEKYEDLDVSHLEEMDHAEELTISNKIKELMAKAFWMQEILGTLIDRVERISNLLSVSPAPFISGVFSCILVLLIILLYLVPLRLILLVWGLNKFRKGLLGYPSKPGELTNLISRVPTTEQLLDVKELPPVSVDTKKLELIRKRASQDSLVI